MIRVFLNQDDNFVIELSEHVRKILRRSAGEWAVDEASHLQALLINLFENKIKEYRNRDGPLMAEKYEQLSEQDQKTIDKLLTFTEDPDA